MWSKISNVLKPLTLSSKEEPQSGSEVLNKVYEQHPNLSVFHSNDSGIVGRQSIEGHSPSVHSKRNMFKRLSRPAPKEEIEEPPLPLPQHPKISSDLNTSLASLPPEKNEVPRRSSFDMLRPSSQRGNQDTTRSVKDSRQRPSLDLLRDGSPNSLRLKSHSNDNDFLSPVHDNHGHNSVRSILRDRNTPGTGQSVRFFGRNDFKVITPDHSGLSDILDKPQPPIPQDQQPFVDRPEQSADPATGSSPSLTRISPGSKPRPKLAGLFAPLDRQENCEPNTSNADMSLSITNPTSAPPANDYSNIFDMSAQLEMPSFPPPGLDFNVDAATFGSSALDASANDISYVVRDDNLDGQHGQMTSTPPKAELKGKEKEKGLIPDDSTEESSIPSSAPAVIDETIFHRKEKSPKLLSPSHERSQSFSFGQTVFYSMNNKSEDKSSEEMEAAYPSSDVRPSLDHFSPPMPDRSPAGDLKARVRAISDTAFQDMLRISARGRRPEADINDESDVMYSGNPSEPDPFSANANTYYTPQVNIPVTPPKGAKHLRQTSKEEGFIISLQTQLALKSELCAQYEADLKARDELVEILGKKLSDVEKDETKRKSALKSWRKKVQELEKTCRQLEEAMDRSRQESMERSVMDEASGEALRMLHRQIASLEGEKAEWVKKEFVLKEELETLETLVSEKSEDVMNLKETLWSRDEDERELKDGLREAKEQIDMIGNISLVGVDEDELRRLMMEREQKSSEETQRFRMKELELHQELEEMKTKLEWLEVQKKGLEEQVEAVDQQLKVKDDEYAVLKAELEAQWQHTEKIGEKVEALEQENTDLAAEKDALKSDVENLEEQISNMENDWTEGENKRSELEAELHDVWNLKDALEHERVELKDSLHQQHDDAEQLRTEIQKYENRIAELEQEKQFAAERISRLEENLRQRDEEVTQYTQRFLTGESEAEQLREEMNKLKREHLRVVNDQSRELQDAAEQQETLKNRMEEFLRAKVEADVESKTNKDRVTSLMDELERLRRQVHTLQQDSADKDLKIVQLSKQVSQDKEDILGLNIALESKQQEMELIKRKLNVRGTGGSTPAQSSKTTHRGDHSIFTATPLSRPSSALSEAATDLSGKEKKISNDTFRHALGKSTRANAIATGTSSLASSATKGSMGPPPAKSRPSTSGTPTPTARTGLVRSSSARAVVTSPTTTSVVHRRVMTFESTPSAKPKLSRSAVNASPAPSAVSELDEKENIDSSSISLRRQNVLIPS